MKHHTLITRLHREQGGRIALVVVDGLGGLPGPAGKTELEAAHTPHLDRLAAEGVTGLLTPIAPGITCGSGPGHLALFGYDPLQNEIGRGVLTALGIDFPLQPGDVAARGNLCTLDEEGRVTDRRAGRPTTEEASPLIEQLDAIEVEGCEIRVRPVKEHRFLLVLRGPDLGPNVRDTDPQRTGVEPKEPRAEEPDSERTAGRVAAFAERARQILGRSSPPRMVLLRGFDRLPDLPSMKERYGLKGCAFAGYPMYRGVARLVGMKVADCAADLDEQLTVVAERWSDNDLLFIHHKPTDSRGEDGAFDAKVAAIEDLDRHLPRLLRLRPEVLVVTGDHSTPSRLGRHSWHEVPVLLHAATCRRDETEVFGEATCLRGGLGRLESRHLMSLALAHAGRLRKFGA